MTEDPSEPPGWGIGRNASGKTLAPLPILVTGIMRIRAGFVVAAGIAIGPASLRSLAQSPASHSSGRHSPAPVDFREATWGMTKAQVLAAESSPPREVRESNGETIVQYDSIKLAGLTGRLVYIFAKDKLVRAKYLLDAEHDDLNDFIADYHAVEPLLMNAHGEPTWEQAVWEDDSLQEERKSYLDQDRALPENILPSDRNVGMAVSLGHLKLFTERGEGRTKILHALTGADGKITHQIEYRSVELSALEDDVRPQAAKP
jgi:hypothetical protein